MEEKNAPSLTHPEVVFVSFFGVGFSPKAPGTCAALAICPILYLLSLAHAPFFVFIPFLVMAAIISSYITHIVQKKYQDYDPSWIVIDEVLGMWTAWIFTHSCGATLSSLIFTFCAYRFFDIIKLWPASYFDKQIKNGAGTILDDIVSGIYAGSLFLLVHHFFPKLFSF